MNLAHSIYLLFAMLLCWHLINLLLVSQLTHTKAVVNRNIKASRRGFPLQVPKYVKLLVEGSICECISVVDPRKEVC